MSAEWAARDEQANIRQSLHQKSSWHSGVQILTKQTFTAVLFWLISDVAFYVITKNKFSQQFYFANWPISENSTVAKICRFTIVLYNKVKVII
jgi:hypothetical protein